MKINPSSSIKSVKGGISTEQGRTNALSQHEKPHNIGTLYITHKRFQSKHIQFDADFRNNLGMEERTQASHLANLASTYGKSDARNAKLEGDRCNILNKA